MIQSQVFYLFGAYLDERENPRAPSVRIIGMVKKWDLQKQKLFCIFWSQNQTQEKTDVVELIYTVR